MHQRIDPSEASPTTSAASLRAASPLDSSAGIAVNSRMRKVAGLNRPRNADDRRAGREERLRDKAAEAALGAGDE